VTPPENPGTPLPDPEGSLPGPAGRDANVVDRLAIPALIASAIVGLCALMGTLSLLRRPFWLDEIHTALLVQDPSFSHAMTALAHGADFNPPALLILSKAFTLAWGPPDGAAIRSACYGAVIVGLIGIYATARQCYSRRVALVATAAVWSHPLVIHHLFEARFYGPWFAAVVWYGLALNLADRSSRRVLPRLFVASTAILVCTIHYFGVFSLALVTLGHFLFARRGAGALLGRLIPVAFGPVALLACLPIYRGQKAALSVPTWIEPVTLQGVRSFAEKIYLHHSWPIAVVVLFLSRLANVGRPDVDDRRPIRKLAGLAFLFAMPAAVVALSMLLQPSLVGRYAIPVVASFGVIIAPVVAGAGPRLQELALVLMALAGMANLRIEKTDHRYKDEWRRSSLAALGALDGSPVVFRERHRLYDLWWDGPEARRSWSLWDTSELPRRPTDFDQVEHDVGVILHRWYDLPDVVPIGPKVRSGTCYLFGYEDEREVAELREFLPDVDFAVVDARWSIYRLTRRPGVAAGRGRPGSWVRFCSSTTPSPPPRSAPGAGPGPRERFKTRGVGGGRLGSFFPSRVLEPSP